MIPSTFLSSNPIALVFRMLPTPRTSWIRWVTSTLRISLWRKSWILLFLVPMSSTWSNGRDIRGRKIGLGNPSNTSLTLRNSGIFTSTTLTSQKTHGSRIQVSRASLRKGEDSVTQLVSPRLHRPVGDHDTCSDCPKDHGVQDSEPCTSLSKDAFTIDIHNIEHCSHVTHLSSSMTWSHGWSHRELAGQLPQTAVSHAYGPGGAAKLADQAASPRALLCRQPGRVVARLASPSCNQANDLGVPSQPLTTRQGLRKHRRCSCREVG